jgi:hypothetical protein
MLRIKTMVGKYRVYTLLYLDKWITLFDNPDGSRGSLASDNLLDAGSAHLQISSRIKGLNK